MAIFQRDLQTTVGRRHQLDGKQLERLDHRIPEAKIPNRQDGQLEVRVMDRLQQVGSSTLDPAAVAVALVAAQAAAAVVRHLHRDGQELGRQGYLSTRQAALVTPETCRRRLTTETRPLFTSQRRFRSSAPSAIGTRSRPGSVDLSSRLQRRGLE